MNDEEIKSWADNLKVGDRVLISGREESIGVVKKLTPTQVHVRYLTTNNSYVFRKKDGKQIGNRDAWSFINILPLSEEKKQQILERERRSHALWQLRQIVEKDLAKIPTDKIQEAITLLNSCKT